MNAIRVKIAAFRLLLLGLVALLCWSWSHRILWLALFLAAVAILGIVGRRVFHPRDRARGRVRMTLFGVAGVVFLFAFIVHGFLFPQWTGLTLVMTILTPLALVPALCYKAHEDYLAFRLARGRGCREGGPTERPGRADRPSDGQRT